MTLTTYHPLIAYLVMPVQVLPRYPEENVERQYVGIPWTS
jgi:hypothetical protein